MRRNVMVGLLLLVACSLAAQDLPTVPINDAGKFEVFAGYQLFRVSPSSRVSTLSDQINVFSTNGVLGSVQYNVNSFVGLVGEVGATRTGGVALANSSVGLDQTQLLYVFGPRVFVHVTPRIMPFMEFLGGGVRDSRTFAVPNSRITPGAATSPGVSAEVASDTTHFHVTQSAFAMMVGTGLNIGVSKRMAIRPLQIDYVGTRLTPVNVPGVPPGINDSTWQFNWKYSAGVTFRFGGTREVATAIAAP